MRESSASSDPSDLSRWIFPEGRQSVTKVSVGVCGVENLLVNNEGDPQNQHEKLLQ